MFLKILAFIALAIVVNAQFSPPSRPPPPQMIGNMSMTRPKSKFNFFCKKNDLFIIY